MGNYQYWIILFIVMSVGLIWSIKRKGTIDNFLVSGRNISGLLGLLSVAVSWTWVPALFVSSQKSYELGLAGFLWFSVPNVAAVVIFYFLAKKMHEINKEGFTLPEFIRKKTHGKSDKFYIITIFLVQIYAIVINLFGSSLVLQNMTGLPSYILIPSIALVALIIVSIKGLFSSIGIDVLKSALVIMLGIIFISLVNKFSFLSFLGKNNTGFNFLDPTTVFAFGLPTAISLISAFSIDQQQWQRSFGLKNTANLKFVYFGAAIFFALILTMMALPGFIASSIGLEVQQTQLISMKIVQQFFPPFISNLLLAVIATSLIAVICAALNAAASVWTVDVKRNFDISSMRMAMIILLFFASIITFIPNLQINWIMMFVGSFRSALFIPTLVILFTEDLNSKLIKNLNLGILIGMIVGPIIFLYGLISSQQYFYTIGTLFPLFTTSFGWLLSRRRDHERVTRQ